jgi:hypothetical protein
MTTGRKWNRKTALSKNHEKRCYQQPQPPNCDVATNITTLGNATSLLDVNFLKACK